MWSLSEPASIAVRRTTWWIDSIKWLIGIMLAFAGVIAPHARADNLVVSRAVLEDTSARLEVSDVLTREFKPLGLTLYEGYSNSAYWLRITIRAPSKGNEAVLLIRQPFLSEVRLYEADRSDASGWRTRVTGSHYANGDGERIGHTPSFTVTVGEPEATYYLRLKTTSAAQLTVEALEPMEAVRRVHQFDLLQVFFATSMLALLVWAIHSYLLDRQPAVGLFAIHQAAYTVYGTAITGYLSSLIPAGFPLLSDAVFIVPYCMVAFTSLLFCRELFRSYDPPPLLMHGLNALLLVFPFQILLIALGHLSLAAIGNFLLVRFEWWYLAIMTFTLRKEQKPSRRTLQVLFAAVTLLFTVFWITYYIGGTTSQSYLFGRQLLVANGLIIGVLFAVLVSARSRKLLAEVQQSATNLELAQRSLLVERQRKHEAEVQARTDYLTGLFNRRHLVEEAERELERAIRYRRPLTVMMIDIDHFKAVNDTWGHGVGDEVLQKVSLLIRETLRNVDLFGRTGGEEFTAVLIETDRAGAVEVAERLRVTVAESVVSARDGSHVQVTISIGLAELGGRHVGFDRLSHEADRALYRAKQAGRNRVLWSDFA